MVEIGQSRGITRLPFVHPEGDGAFVEALTLRQLRERTTFRIARVDFFVLQIVTGGAGCHWIDFERVPITAGDLLMTSEGQVHGFDTESTHDGFLILFRSEAITASVTPRLLMPLRPEPIRLPEADTVSVQRIAKLMVEAQAAGGGMGSQAAMRHLVHAVLACAERAVAPAHPLSTSAHALARLLDDHVTRQRDVGWYARSIGVSPRTLSRACAQEFGLSAKATIDRRVVLEAKRLLVHTDWTVNAIGTHLAFGEATNFVKYFRRVAGVTPAVFRKQLR